MEFRQILKAMLLSMAAFFVWMYVWSTYLAPRPPLPTTPASSQAASYGTTTSGPASRPASSAPAGLSVAQQAETVKTYTLGSAEPGGPFELAVETTNQGAGIRIVRLANYAVRVGEPERYRAVDVLTAPADAAVPGQEILAWVTEKIEIDDSNQLDEPFSGVEFVLADLRWVVEHVETADDAENHSVRFAAEVRDSAGAPLLKLVKIFTLGRTATGDKVADDKRVFHLDVDLTLENLAARPLRVRVTQRGPVGVPKEGSRMDWRQAVGAVRRGEAVEIEEHVKCSALMAAEPEPEKGPLPWEKMGGDEERAEFAWAAIINKYFVCTAAVMRREGGADAMLVAVSRAKRLAYVDDENLPTGIAVEIETSTITLAPHATPQASRTLSFQAYFGPKAQGIFQAAHYAEQGYGSLVAYGVGSCTFDFLSAAMIWLLKQTHSLTGNYGLAIVLLVVLVKTLLHPVTKKAQVNMMKMQKSMATLQPKMEELKQKYGDDRQRLNEATMKLYRDEGTSPFGQVLGCLPMFLQMPIWIALWTALSSTVEMRHAPLFMEGYWIKDLAGPDALIPFDGPLPLWPVTLITGPILAFNLLPVLQGISMWLQQKFMAKLTRPTQVPGKTSAQAAQQQAMQQRMMGFMSVFFVFILFNAPSGLNLYIMTSNLFGMLEQWRIRKHIRDEEAKGNLSPKKPKKSRSHPSWLERLQKAAAEAQRVKSARKK